MHIRIHSSPVHRAIVIAYAGWAATWEPFKGTGGGVSLVARWCFVCTYVAFVGMEVEHIRAGASLNPPGCRDTGAYMQLYLLAFLYVLRCICVTHRVTCGCFHLLYYWDYLITIWRGGEF